MNYRALPTASITAFPVILGGGTTTLWAARTRRGILRRLFASRISAENEAKAYDDSDDAADDDELIGRYASLAGTIQDDDVAFWWCEDLGGKTWLTIEMPSDCVFERAFKRRREAVDFIEGLLDATSDTRQP